MLPRLRFAFLLAPIVAVPLGASPIITTELVSFTSNVSASIGGQSCSDPFACDLTDGIVYGTSASANVSESNMSLNLDTKWGGQDQGYANATASFSIEEQVTITGGTGTGIAVACVTGYDSLSGLEPILSANVGLSGTREPGYLGDGCGPAPGPFASASAAADFTYGVPFDLFATVTASGEAGFGHAPCTGCWEGTSISADPQFTVVDPPSAVDPAPAIPEPSSMVPCLMLGVYGLIRRLRAPRQLS